MVKTVKKWFFIKLNLNSMASYFEITLSFRTLYKGFRTIFVFKFGPKTKKFTPKWQIPLFEKRVPVQSILSFHPKSVIKFAKKKTRPKILQVS